MKLLICLIMMLPGFAFAQASGSTGEMNEVRLEEKTTIQGNWERGRDRAKRSWGYACADFKDDAEDELEKDRKIHEISCGQIRCKMEGKKMRCESTGVVHYIKSTKQSKM